MSVPDAPALGWRGFEESEIVQAGFERGPLRLRDAGVTDIQSSEVNESGPQRAGERGSRSEGESE